MPLITTRLIHHLTLENSKPCKLILSGFLLRCGSTHFTWVKREVCWWVVWHSVMVWTCIMWWSGVFDCLHSKHFPNWKTEFAFIPLLNWGFHLLMWNVRKMSEDISTLYFYRRDGYMIACRQLQKGNTLSETKSLRDSHVTSVAGNMWRVESQWICPGHETLAWLLFTLSNVYKYDVLLQFMTSLLVLTFLK